MIAISSVLIVVITRFGVVDCEIGFEKNVIKVPTGTNVSTHFFIRNENITNETVLRYEIEDKLNIIEVVPASIPFLNISEKKSVTLEVKIRTYNAGRAFILANLSDTNLRKESYLIVEIFKNVAVEQISIVFGWMYCFCWAVAIYPQIWQNFKRKSVIGYNLDYLALNIVGHSYYMMFNVGLYFIPIIQKEYRKRYPQNLIPVFANDVVFATHGSVCTGLVIFQCFRYERGDQRVSNLVRIAICLLASLTLLCVGLIHFRCIHWHWLDFVYFASYVKLIVTLKYTPQVYMNYKRKSTDGYNVGNVLLDLSGGLLSLSQMVLNACNYNSWSSFWRNPTKFGIGLLTLSFDGIMLTQHYLLYNKVAPVDPDKKDQPRNSVII